MAEPVIVWNHIAQLNTHYSSPGFCTPILELPGPRLGRSPRSRSRIKARLHNAMQREQNTWTLSRKVGESSLLHRVKCARALLLCAALLACFLAPLTAQPASFPP